MMKLGPCPRFRNCHDGTCRANIFRYYIFCCFDWKWKAEWTTHAVVVFTMDDFGKKVLNQDFFSDFLARDVQKNDIPDFRLMLHQIPQYPNIHWMTTKFTKCLVKRLINSSSYRHHVLCRIMTMWWCRQND